MLREPLKRTELHYVFCGTPVEEHWSRTLILQNTALCSKHTFPNSKYRSTRYTFISLTLTPNLHPASHILITSSKMRLYDACCLQNRWICFGWEPNKQIKFLSYRRQRPSNAWWRFPTMEVSTLGSSRSWRTCGFQCWEVSTESRGTICLMFVAFQVFGNSFCFFVRWRWLILQFRKRCWRGSRPRTTFCSFSFDRTSNIPLT